MTTINLSDLIDTSQPSSLEKIQAIKHLQEYGFHTLPVCGIFNGTGTCGRRNEALTSAGKHPAPTVKPNDANINQNITEIWYTERPFDNVAIHCRKSKILVIDIDPRSGGFDSWSTFIERFELEIPKTIQVLTGLYGEVRGNHMYFSYEGEDEFVGDLSSFGLPGVDIKYNGFVVAPPSVHYSGANYEFMPGAAPWEIAIAPLPDALNALLRKTGDYRGLKPVIYPEGSLSFLVTCTEDSTPYGKAALEGECTKVSEAQEGTRNNTLFKVGVRLAALVAGGEIAYEDMFNKLKSAALRSGLDDDEISAVLLRDGGAFAIGASQPVSSPKPSDALLEWARKYSAIQDEDITEAHIDFLNRAKVVDLYDMFAEHEPERWFVPGFICSGRGHALLSSSGVGKSLLMRELCAKLALGESIWGHPEQEPLRILYLDYENDPVYDIGATLKEMRLDIPQAYEGRLTFLSYPEFGYFDTAAGAQDIEYALDVFKPDLVVIDTLSRVVEGEENSNDTWLKFYKSVGLVLKRRNQAYVRIDHLGKNTDKGARGGSAKTGDIDLIWTLEQRKDGYFDLKNSKSRAYLKNKNLVIQRRNSPLEHVLIETPEVDWVQLLEQASKYENLLIWLAELDAVGSLKGQRATWESYKGELTDMGVTKSLLESAHKEYKGLKEMPQAS